MICPVCSVQMHQKDQVGGGTSTDAAYVTWEVKECPGCGRVVLERYSVEILGEEEWKSLKK